jgi:hypothetical protein
VPSSSDWVLATSASLVRLSHVRTRHGIETIKTCFVGHAERLGASCADHTSGSRIACGSRQAPSNTTLSLSCCLTKMDVRACYCAGFCTRVQMSGVANCMCNTNSKTRFAHCFAFHTGNSSLTDRPAHIIMLTIDIRSSMYKPRVLRQRNSVSRPQTRARER